MDKPLNQNTIILNKGKAIIEYINVLIDTVKANYTGPVLDWDRLYIQLNLWLKDENESLKLNESDSKVFREFSFWVYEHISEKLLKKLNEVTQQEIAFINLYFENFLKEDVDLLGEQDDILRLKLEKGYLMLIIFAIFGIGLIFLSIYITFIKRNEPFWVPLVVFSVGVFLLLLVYSSFKKKQSVLIFAVKDNILRYYDEKRPKDFITWEYYLPDLTQIWIFKHSINFMPVHEEIKIKYKNTERHFLPLSDIDGSISKNDLDRLVTFIHKHNPHMKVGYK